MNRSSKFNFFLVLSLFLLVSVSTAGAFELSISKINAGIEVQPNYNRSTYYSWDIAAFALMELNNCFGVSGGFAIGQIWDVLDIKSYLTADFAQPFFRKYAPLNLKFSWLYNGMPDYYTHIHTLLPTLSLNYRYFGFEAGPAFRYTLFDKDPALLEVILEYSVFANFINTDDTKIGIGLSNFDEYTANNFASYSFRLYNFFRVSPHIAVKSDFFMDMSGNVARITSVYGVRFREGIVFTW